MPYQITLEGDGTYRLDSPDGTEVQNFSRNFSEADADLWMSVVEHAQRNQLMGEAIATVAAGFEFTDNR